MVLGIRDRGRFLESLFFDGYDPYLEGDEPRVCRGEKARRIGSLS